MNRTLEIPDRHREDRAPPELGVAREVRGVPAADPAADLWLRTNGVNAYGAAAEVMSFDGSGKKVRPGTFGKIKVG